MEAGPSSIPSFKNIWLKWNARIEQRERTKRRKNPRVSQPNPSISLAHVFDENNLHGYVSSPPVLFPNLSREITIQYNLQSILNFFLFWIQLGSASFVSTRLIDGQKIWPRICTVSCNTEALPTLINKRERERDWTTLWRVVQSLWKK